MVNNSSIILFHMLLFLYIFLSVVLYFWLAFHNKEKLGRTVFIFFFILATCGALILWLDINIKNIRGPFKASVSPKSGLDVNYEPNIDDIVSTVNKTKTEIVDKIEENKLYIEPLEMVFYKPQQPEAEGQIKARFVALVKNRSKEIAKNVKFNFIVDDGRGRIVSSREWNRFVGAKEKIFDIYPDNIVLLSWTPDMPSRQFYVDNKDKYIQLTIEIEWEDLEGQSYKAENISQIRYNPADNNFYFEVIKVSYLSSIVKNVN